MSQLCDTIRVPGVNPSDFGRSRRLISGSRYSVTTEAEEKSNSNTSGTLDLHFVRDTFRRDEALRKGDQVGVVLDADGGCAEVFRGRDGDAPVSRSEIEHAVALYGFGQLQHLRRVVTVVGIQTTSLPG